MGRTNEALWEKSKTKAKAKVGGKHSARAMQLAGKMYKDAGGKYSGSKTTAQKSMSNWTKEDWGTKSGKNSTEGSKATGERYLPAKARQALTDKEYKATTAKKQADTAKGKQFSKQPEKIAKKVKTIKAAKGGVIMNKMPNEGMKQLKKAAPAVAKKMGYSKGGMKKTMGYKAGGVVKAKCGASYTGK